MKNVSKSTKALILAGLSVIVIVTAAWQTDSKTKGNTGKQQQQGGDTAVPKQYDYNKNEYRLGDIDVAMKALDSAMVNLNIQLKDLNINISKEVTDALAQIDFEKMNKEIKEAMQGIDIEKIKQQTEKSLQDAKLEMSKLDTEELKKAMEDAQKEMKNIDLENIKLEIDKSMKEAQEQIKNIDMQKLKTDMQQMQLKLSSPQFKMQIDSAMKNAQQDIEKARKELQDIKDFTNTLEKDGLIDKKKGYSIEWTKDGDLFINGTKQPKSVADKYSRYYKKDGYKIKSDGGDDELDTETL